MSTHVDRYREKEAAEVVAGDLPRRRVGNRVSC